MQFLRAAFVGKTEGQHQNLLHRQVKIGENRSNEDRKSVVALAAIPTKHSFYEVCIPEEAWALVAPAVHLGANQLVLHAPSQACAPVLETGLSVQPNRGVFYGSELLELTCSNGLNRLIKRR